MELSNEQLDSIRNIIRNGKLRNRNEILAVFFKDKKIFKDDKTFKVFELYKNAMRTAQYTDQGSLELDISKKLDISKENVNSIIQYIDFISKKVEYEIRYKYMGSYYKTHIKKLKNEQNEVRKMNECKTAYIKKEEVQRRQLDTIFKNYEEASKTGKLSIKKLKNNIDGIENRIKLLGNLTLDRLFLAAMYADIGEVDKCNAILYKFEFDKLSRDEKERYKKAKVKEIRVTNINYISSLYAKGYSYEQIKEECEKQATSYRAGITAKGEQKVEAIGLTPDFIKKVYNKLLNGQIKVSVNKNEKEL